MVFSTAADDGGPVRERNASHYVFQIVNVSWSQPASNEASFKSFSSKKKAFQELRCCAAAVPNVPPSSSFQHDMTGAT